jgi:uncharacterized small protein (TIGR04563 family)
VSASDPKIEKRNRSFYFPTEMADEIMAEAWRLDRSMSWVVQRAWKIARKVTAEIERE